MRPENRTTLREIAATRPVRAGVVHWPSGEATLVVKVTLELRGDGAFWLSSANETEPLKVDTFDASGLLTYPSDFAPYKPACDVVVLSDVDPGAPGELIVGPLQRSLAPYDSAGARETFCPGGDPTDASALPLWTGPGADFSRFQVAPPAQRIPHPTASFHVALSRGVVHMKGQLHPPRLGLTIVGHGQEPVSPLPANLDFVGLEPERARVILLYRAVCSSALAQAATSVVATLDDGTASLGHMGAWFRTALVGPSEVAAAARRTWANEAPISVETRVVSPDEIRSDPLPFAPIANETKAATEVLRRRDLVMTLPAAHVPADPLPFPSPPTSEPRPGVSPEEFAALRGGAPVPVPSFDGNETQLLEWGREGVRERAICQDPRARSTKESVAPGLSEAPPLDPAVVSAISREVWAGVDSLGVILARHGVTEAAWQRVRPKKR